MSGGDGRGEDDHNDDEYDDDDDYHYYNYYHHYNIWDYLIIIVPCLIPEMRMKC